MVLVAVVGNPDALDQFHDEVGPAVVGRPGIEDLGDVRMVHEGQGLPLGLEAGDNRYGVHTQLDYLEGDTAANRLSLLGHIDYSAAALADPFEQLVVADALALQMYH